MRNIWVTIGGLFTISYVLAQQSKKHRDLVEYKQTLNRNKKWWQHVREKLIREEMMVEDDVQ